MFGPDSAHHTFKVGDLVRIARISDNMTSRHIIGHRGVITELDDISNSSVEMKCSTCHSFHTMHEQELDFFGNELVQLLQEKAHIPDDPVAINASNENLEDFLAVGMYRAGFDRISVQDRPVPAGDPRFPRPVWSKHVYGVITRLAPFRVYHDALIKIAEQAGGYLAEWSSYLHQKGWDSVITEDDLDTLTMEMPIRAVMVAQASTQMGDYEEIKDMVIYWLQDKHQIDIGAIYRSLKVIGFGMGNWSHRQSTTVNDYSSYSMNVEWLRHDGEGFETFREWAGRTWDWVGEFGVYIEDKGSTRDNGFGKIEELYITKKPNEPVKIEEVEDVPF